MVIPDLGLSCLELRLDSGFRRFLCDLQNNDFVLLLPKNEPGLENPLLLYQSFEPCFLQCFLTSAGSEDWLLYLLVLAGSGVCVWGWGWFYKSAYLFLLFLSSVSVCEERFGSYLCSRQAIFKIIIIPNNVAHTGTEMGHKWITYFLYVFSHYI